MPPYAIEKVSIASTMEVITPTLRNSDNFMFSDIENSRRSWRDFLIAGRLINFKAKFTDFRKRMVDRYWKKLQVFLLENHIDSTEEDARAITQDIVTSVNDYSFDEINSYEYDYTYGCDTLDLIMTRKYLERIYNEKYSMDHEFEIALSCRFHSFEWKMFNLNLKEIMPLVSTIFYDGIRLLYVSNENN